MLLGVRKRVPRPKTSRRQQPFGKVLQTVDEIRQALRKKFLRSSLRSTREINTHHASLRHCLPHHRAHRCISHCGLDRQGLLRAFPDLRHRVVPQKRLAAALRYQESPARPFHRPKLHLESDRGRASFALRLCQRAIFASGVSRL
jgi:hypothetical protein